MFEAWCTNAQSDDEKKVSSMYLLLRHPLPILELTDNNNIFAEYIDFINR